MTLVNYCLRCDSLHGGDCKAEWPSEIGRLCSDLAQERQANSDLAEKLSRLRAELAECKRERDEAQSLAYAFEEGSAEWEESFRDAKALEKAAIEKWQRYKAERDVLREKLLAAEARAERLKGALERIKQQAYNPIYDPNWAGNCFDIACQALSSPPTDLGEVLDACEKALELASGPHDAFEDAPARVRARDVLARLKEWRK